MMGLVKLVDGLNGAIRWVLAACLLGMTLCTLWQVAVRFLLSTFSLNIAAPWTEEVARYLMIWVIFLGASIACRKAQLISLDVVVFSLPRKIGVFMRYVSLVVCLAFFVLMVQLGMEFLEFGAIESSPVLSISKTWVYAAMPLGFSLMILNTVALIIETISRGEDIRFTNGENVE